MLVITWGWILGVLGKTIFVQLLVLIVIWFLRRTSAATRHAVISCGIAVVLALPVITWVIPTWHTGLIPESMQGQAATERTTTEVSPGGSKEATFSGVLAGNNTAPDPAQLSAMKQALFTRGSFDLPILLWMLGLASVSLWLIGGYLFSIWITRKAKGIEDSGIISIFEDTSKKLGLRKLPVLLSSDRIIVPVVCGFLHPKIIIPETALYWPDRRLQSILLHELAHIRRKDLLIRIAARLCCAFYWFNPLIWIMERKLMIEGERACDDQVLEQQIKPSEYAEHLLRVSEELGKERQAAWALAPMAEGTDFKDRILSILDPNAIRTGSKSPYTLLAIGLTVVMALPVAAFNPFEPAIEPSIGPINEPQQEAEAKVSQTPSGQGLQRETPEAEPSLAKILIEIIQTGDEQLMEHAAAAAGRQKEKTAVPALCELLTAPSPRIREHAATALGQIGDLAALPALIKLLNDDNAGVREHAASALGTLGDPQAVQALTSALLHEQDSRVKRHILESLAEIQNKETLVPELEKQ